LDAQQPLTEIDICPLQRHHFTTTPTSIPAKQYDHVRLMVYLLSGFEEPLMLVEVVEARRRSGYPQQTNSARQAFKNRVV